MQQVKRVTGWFVGCVWVAAAAGCGATSAPDVDFADGTPIGTWQNAGPAATSQNVTQPKTAVSAPVAGSAATAPASTTGPGSALPTASGSGPVTSPSSAVAGSPALSTGMQAAAGRPAPAGSAGSGAITKPPVGGSAAPSAGTPATEPPAAGGIQSLTFEVTTAPAGMRYQPKNIGAIWIQNSSGAFVKSLQVWARTRARYLTKYSSARGGQAVDVTASATLNSHQTHMVTWDLKDRSGAAVPPGKYTLFAELTDGDATGKFTSVEFDTSADPRASNPPDAPCFNSMKLELK